MQEQVHLKDKIMKNLDDELKVQKERQDILMGVAKKISFKQRM